jgi:PAS domain S-box-containing protein
MPHASRDSQGTAVAADTHLGLRIVAPILALGLILETGAHALGSWGPEANVALASLVLSLPIALLWHWRPLRLEHAHSGIALLVAIVIVNDVSHVAVGNVAGAEVFLGFGIVATGAFVMSRIWLAPLLAGQLIAWFMLIGVRGQLVVLPITLTMLSLAIHVARRHGAETAHARQAELEAANAQLHLAQDALDCAGDPILWVSTEGAIIYANRSAALLLGHTTEEVVGIQIGQIDLRLSLQDLEAGAATEKTIETTYRGRDGGLHPVEVQSRRVQVEGRTFHCVIARDLTQRRRIEEKLSTAQRLESLGVLAAGLAHDFNNLLAGMIGNADLALDVAGTASPVRPLLERVLDAGDRATLLTTQLLAYAGGSVADRQKLDLAVEIHEIANLLAASLPKGVRLEIDPPTADLPAVNADRGQLQQIVMNFVVNAGEAIGGETGTVRMRTLTRCFTVEEASRLEPTMDRPAGLYAGFEVLDDGCGMDDATRARVFDPFFTTKAHGRGLGLAAVLGITRRHGGGIEIESVPGVGSTLRVFLQAADSAAVTSSHQPATPPEGDGLALVVDDEPAVLDVAKRYLESFGFEVIVAEDGVEAVEAVRDRKDELRLVLLDLTLPRMSGREVFGAIQKIRSDIPIVLSSGYEAVPEAMPSSMGAPVRFLKKPYRRHDLSRVVREVVDP